VRWKQEAAGARAITQSDLQDHRLAGVRQAMGQVTRGLLGAGAGGKLEGTAPKVAANDPAVARRLDKDETRHGHSAKQ
jgi:hypothetical protein